MKRKTKEKDYFGIDIWVLKTWKFFSLLIPARVQCMVRDKRAGMAIV